MSNFHHPFTINEKNHLQIGEHDAVELAQKYGTPLYVYDVNLIRQNARAFVDTFAKLDVQAQVAYASKAFSSIAMVEIAKQENLSLDVVSEGELYTALKAGFPVDKIHLHGNNKSRAELEMAIEHQIGCIVIDNLFEIELIHEILEETNQEMNCLLRVTPGIESDTHRYIMTGNEDSKFGFNITNGGADEAFQTVTRYPRINLQGLHCHIGSQIFESDRFIVAIRALFDLLKNWKETYHFIPEVLNVGGGFGIRYTKDDQPLPYEQYVESIVEEIQKETLRLDIPLPEIWIEPGRSLVGNTAVTLYSIGSEKKIPGIRDYLSVDGGMSDNLRPALYEAEYEAVVANKMNNPMERTVSIAGKCCESGDMLIWDLEIPEVQPGDILAVFSTGAYGYSMANNYNRFSRPAVVFVEGDQEQLVVQRESLEDIIKNDLHYKISNEKSFTKK